MSKQSYLLAGKIYESKELVKARCRELLYAGDCGDSVMEHQFLLDLVSYHSEAEYNC